LDQSASGSRRPDRARTGMINVFPAACACNGI
jgi:hypothetical protein